MTEAELPVKARHIKLGIDVHLDRYVVVRTLDGGTPQPPQRFGPPEFLLWVAKQITLAEKVFTCYEAGPFGYSLHRKLEQMGAANYVVRPRDWDEYGQQVKTDKRDAKQLALHLDRYVNGNQDAFCIVRVPSPEQEQARSISRQRESFQRERQRLAAQGRSHALYYGGHLQGEWWQEAAWKSAVAQLPTIAINLLEPLRRLIAALDMARKLRVQYPGAIYHVMNRGDRRKEIFRDDKDRVCFIQTLEESFGLKPPSQLSGSQNGWQWALAATSLNYCKKRNGRTLPERTNNQASEYDNLID
jgi:hypothetical protein